MLDVSPVRAFSDNYFWLIRSPVEPTDALVVDPGEAGPVDDALDRLGLRLRGILVTHHHGDHVGGVQELTNRHAVPAWGPAHDPLPCAVNTLDDGDTLALESLGLQFSVMAVPGHTLGHIAYVGHGALFCGDTLFSGGCGRLFEGSPQQMLSSLDRLAALPAETRVYCAHEYTLSNLRFANAADPHNPAVAAALSEVTDMRSRDEITLPSTIGRERRINPFLRCREPSVRAAAEQQCGRPLTADVDVFAAVRAWKDGFR
jgi:hydroxyacylglutathione hydrolase